MPARTTGHSENEDKWPSFSLQDGKYAKPQKCAYFLFHVLELLEKKMCVLLITRALRSHYPSSDVNACSPSERESEFAIAAHFSFIHSRPMPGLIDRAWVCGRHRCPQCRVCRKALPAVWIRPVASDLYKLLFLIVVKSHLSFGQKATVTDQLGLVWSGAWQAAMHTHLILACAFSMCSPTNSVSLWKSPHSFQLFWCVQNYRGHNSSSSFLYSLNIPVGCTRQRQMNTVKRSDIWWSAVDN